MPSAALIDVLEWPTPKVSYSLSRARRERREAVLLLDGAQLVAPAGQHLVRIGLVADVPHEPVVRRVEDIVQRDRELDGAEAGGEVAAASCATRLDQVLRAARSRASPSFAGVSARRSAGELDRARAAGTALRSRMAREFTVKPVSSLRTRPSAVRDARQRVAASARRSGPSARKRAIASQLVHASRAPLRGRRMRRIGRLDASAHRRRSPCRAARGRLRRRGCRPGSGMRGRSRAPNSSSASRGRFGATLGAGGGHQHARLDQRAGLARVHVLDLGQRRAVGRRLRDRSPGRRPCRACRSRSASSRSISRRTRGVRRQSRTVREHLEREHLQRIADENRGRFVEGAVAGRPAAAQIVVVHRRQVVVHQPVDVDEFDRAGGAVERSIRRCRALRRSRRRAPGARACRRRARCSASLRADASGAQSPAASARRARARCGSANVRAAPGTADRGEISTDSAVALIVFRIERRGLELLRRAALAQQDLDFLLGLLAARSGTGASAPRRARSGAATLRAAGRPARASRRSLRARRATLEIGSRSLFWAGRGRFAVHWKWLGGAGGTECAASLHARLIVVNRPAPARVRRRASALTWRARKTRFSTPLDLV